MKLKICAAVILTVGLIGCAKRPDAIVPVDIPMAAYTNLGCSGLAQELAKERTTLASLSKHRIKLRQGMRSGCF